jgi:ring-1,2-phenylacetyl-CoA epoxidase subunit PaaC
MDNTYLTEFSIRLADDALILGQRLCEWSGKAPTLEEDLALSNVALDMLGRARMLYGYAADLSGSSEDELAFLRDAREFKNLLIMELPCGDFAFTMARQYLVDVFEREYFAKLSQSNDPQLAAIAAKTSKEVRYHTRRSQQWMQQLGLGTVESQQRLQRAVEELWGYVDEMFQCDALEQHLVDCGVAVARSSCAARWKDEVTQALHACAIKLPDTPWQVSGGRDGVHTEHLGHLLSELQFMQRAYPGLQW